MFPLLGDDVAVQGVAALASFKASITDSSAISKVSTFKAGLVVVKKVVG